ncbi:MAG: hypothetical protein IJP56_03500 [Synergistaceae bacterium]|nr:hypothetical protein [Synergistaceae bacterium]MBR0222183.1 hypothetical protein [Synergistaceae bacterium]
MSLKKYAIIFLAAFLLLFCGLSAFAAEEDEGSSAGMMERIETLIYGEVSKGGLVDRLGTVERELFGRSLPGTVAERHAAILNFLEIGTEEQPSMMFKIGVAEWIVNKRNEASESALRRLERLENNLDGALQYGSPVAMRVERILATLVTDPVTSQVVKLPAKYVLKLRFMDELSPAISKKGDQVRLELMSDVIINGCLVAPAGSLLLTEIREVKKPRMFGVPGEVRLNFKELRPLGPQHPNVTIGAEAQKAIADARKAGDRGEGPVIGAGAASIAGAAILGPIGLVSGFFIRGNSLKIAAGSRTYLQIAEDTNVAAYQIPYSLLPADVKAEVDKRLETERDQQSYNPDRDTIIKGDVFHRGTNSDSSSQSASSAYSSYSESSSRRTSNTTTTTGPIELPPEDLGY